MVFEVSVTYIVERCWLRVRTGLQSNISEWVTKRQGAKRYDGQGVGGCEDTCCAEKMSRDTAGHAILFGEEGRPASFNI